jgi:ER-bound oxygenase mpaB/B'/Rubber oxygenase, catalytic domain
MDRGVSTEHVQSVLAIDDRVLRNYWVTQTYSDLAAGLTSLLQPGTANWCTFGTWASCTVGGNLRGEALPDWLHHRVVLSDGMMGAAQKANAALRGAGLDGGFHCVGSEHLIDILRERFGACATNLSDGNTEVFAEIAPAAATFLSCFGGDPQDLATARATALRACEGAPVFEGRNRLRAGFEHWCDALAESDATRRSQLILTGSLELGAHEQHHLQGPIAGSMDMGLNDTVALLKRRLTKDAPGPPAMAEAVDALLHPLGHAISDLWGDLMTELLGTIETPDGTLRLNRDVPPLPGQPFVAPDLTPVVVDDLATLFERYDRATEDGRGSRALDWVDLNGRMNFIANLFQSRHHRIELFQPPFGTDVLVQIEAGRIPVTPSRSPARGSVRSADGVKRLQQVIPPSRGTKVFTDAFVETLRKTGDEPADAAVGEYFKAPEVGHSTLFRRLSSTAVGAATDEDLPGIGAFAKLEENWPDWANPELVRDGQRVFGEFGPQLGMGLFMASLPADYAFAKGVQALGRTARLTRDPKRRYVETGQMIIDVMTPGALDPGRNGYRVVRHVRLMHAAVRHVLLHLAEIERDAVAPIEPWDDALGKPINQLQLLGTLFSFSVEGIKALKRSGVRLSTYQMEAYIHVWNLVGHQIGIQNDLLPLSWADSQELWDHRRRTEYGPTAEGKELTKAAIACMQELFGFTQLPGLPATGIRHYLGNETADMLGVPKADWTRVIFELMYRTDQLYEFALVRMPGTGPIASLLGRRIWQGFELYGRGDGHRPAFQVTDELKDAWGMKSR